MIKTHVFQEKRNQLLQMIAAIQLALLGIIPLATSSSYYRVLKEGWVVPGTNIWDIHRSALWGFFSYPLLLLLLSAGIALGLDAAFRQQVLQTTEDILYRQDGLWWILLALWIPITAQWALDSEISSSIGVHVMAELAMAFLLASHIRQGKTYPLLIIYVVGIAAHALIAIGQAVLRHPLGLTFLGEVPAEQLQDSFTAASNFRAYGLSGNPNLLAGNLMLGLFAAQALFAMHLQRKRSLILPVLCGSIIALGLLVTISRAAIAGAVLGSCLTGWYFLRAQNRALLPKIPRLVWGGLGILLVFTLIITGTRLENRFSETINLENSLPRLTYGYSYTLDVIRDYPWLGRGTGNLMLEVGSRYPGNPDHLMPAHNAYLVMWAEAGLIGFALLLMVCLMILRKIPAYRGHIAVIWGACFAAICLTMLLDFYFFHFPARGLLFWVLGMWWGSAAAHEQ